MGARDEPIADLARSRVGSFVGGKWRLERVLGVGGMASVYAASHANAHKSNHVAVKMLHRSRSALPGLAERFLRDGFAANAVAHPGVVRALDGGVADDGSAFLVMELVDGETLEAHWIRRSRQLSAGEVLYIIDRVLDVLEAAHDAGVLHRDVKPENVMLTREGMIKLLDFGAPAPPDVAPSSRRERPDLTMGTPAFMAPEQLRGPSAETDARADLWAVGATMFLLLTGRHVHSAPSLHEQVTAAATRDAPSLREPLPFTAPELIEFVDRALAFKKEERWQSAAAMREGLRKVASAMGELVDKWDIDVPPACVSSRPIPLSIRPSELSSVVDSRTPTLPTFALGPLRGWGLQFVYEQRRLLTMYALVGAALLTAIGFWAMTWQPLSNSSNGAQRRVDALASQLPIRPIASASASAPPAPRPGRPALQAAD